MPDVSLNPLGLPAMLAMGGCLLSIVLFAATPTSGADVEARHSALWGEAGEQWDPTGRLPDFSHAGYRRGEAPLPRPAVVANVRDFGAAGDGEQDDTEAIRGAIEAVDRGAILLPAGRYRITDIIEIRKPGVVLRGEGPDRTVLFFPRPLQEIRPNMSATTGGRPTSNYSWSGGLIWVRGDFRSRPLAEVAEPAKRGETTLTVGSPEALSVGQEVEIRVDDDAENSLAEHLYAGQPGDTANLEGRLRSSLVARIVAIDGDRITLDRRLPFDVELRWQPRVLAFDPTVTDAGIEDLAFEFPVHPYEGHFTEQGYNPIAFNNAAHCWVRNIAIRHCDSGIFVSGRFCTIEDIVFDSDRQPDKAGSVGHHGVTMGGQDNLLQRFRYNVRFVHDITVTAGSRGNVIAEGSGVDLCFDHHRRAPYQNLFTDIDLGAGTRMYRSGGGHALGRHAAARTTFWKIRAEQPQSWPPEHFAPDLINLVGVSSDQPPVKDPDGRWFEPIDPEALAPANLHEAQRERRLGHNAGE